MAQRLKDPAVFKDRSGPLSRPFLPSIDLFDARGFHTGKINGRMQGFFHGTGHGLGLDIHEPPRIAPVDATLRAGHVVTVEPGLYYLGVGGVRLEDVVLVTPKGNRNLTDCPQFLEI